MSETAITHTDVGTQMTKAEYEASNSHTLPTGAEMPVIVRKSSDEVVNNSNVLQNDDELVLAIAANKTWYFRFVLNFLSGTTPNIKFAITVPTGATLRAQMRYWHETQVAYAVAYLLTSGSSAQATGRGVTDGSSNCYVVIEGTVANGANAGNIQLQWAQSTADASNTTVKANSLLEAIPIA